MIYRDRKDVEYTCLWNSFICDYDMKPKTKCVLMYLISKPPNWRPNIRDITNHNKHIGIKAVRIAMRELIGLGHVVVEQSRHEDGRFGSVLYHVYETPLIQAEKEDSPHVPLRVPREGYTIK